MARGRARPVAAVTLPEILLPELRAGTDRDLQIDGDVEGRVFTDLALDGLTAERAQLSECRLDRCGLGEARLRDGRLTSCVLQDLHATELDIAGSTWLDVAVQGGRIGALLATSVQFRRVTFLGTRLDYLNLRGADLMQVRFRDCRIEELDLGSAELRDVRLDGCVLGGLALTGSACADVHLEGAQLASLDGLGSLTGVTIDELQLLRLAPALAAHVGLTVVPAG